MPPKKKQCVRAKLKKKREDSQSRRQQETTSDEEGRRRRDRMSRFFSRALENEDDRATRREQLRISAAHSRALENEDDRATRREQLRISAAHSRALENEDERSARRTRNRTSTAQSRGLENEEERSARRTRDRNSTAESRALENEEERSARRTRDRNSTRNSRELIWRNKVNAAFSYDPSIDYPSDPSIVIGRMSITCPHCECLKWKGETPGMCCSSGKVRLRPLNDPPETLQSLLTDDKSDALHFRNNIRSYNSCFQMTSFGASKEVREPGYMPTFKVQGQVYHLIGSLQPLPNEDPKFLQIYFVGDNVQQADLRCKNVPRVKQDIILLLQEMLHREHMYVNSFKLAMEKVTPEKKLMILADKTPKGEHERRYNVPTTSEVAVIMSGEQHGTRDIILETKSRAIKKIADTHRSYDTLQYPLMFWQGEDGYNFLLQQFNPSTGLFTNRKISAMDFYAFRMMVRPSSFNIILKCKDLFHQYIVDMYAKIESERLRYILLNQKTLRVEQYAHLKDAVVNDGNVANIGQLIILPSSFTGGPRYMHERTQDAMTYVRNYGRPDLFITFTCNPTWEDIQNELFPGQKPQDRHDLLARVFHQKHKALMSLINKGKIFGNVRCYMYTIEWQKRGLPHAHILLWLQDTIHVHRVDDFIKAEIPDSVEDPNLFSIVTTQMVHGPCGSMNPNSPCMKNGKCTKRYPRGFLKETQTGQDGYPLYRRRSPEDGGFTATVTVRRSEVFVDNRWIVPYCPLLSRIFKAHINVEFCNSVKSIKYVCKYVNKGSDMAVFDVSAGRQEHNEIHNYQMGRYISSNEAVWRILNFPIHERHPTVIHLSVHLENGQRVYFTSTNAAEKAQVPQPTTLTAFFNLCIEDDFARTLLYHQVPKYYTWNNGTRKWNRRKIGNNVENQVGIRSSDALGRVYTVHPNNSECFHLRLLLHEVRGPTSFQHLKTFGENICETYKEACQLRGMLEDDQHWNATLEEAAASRSPKMMRELFAVMLQICSMSTPYQLWVNHREQMSEDLLHQTRIQHQNMELNYNEDIFNKALIILEDKVKSLGGTDLKTLGLPQPVRQPHDSSLSEDVFRELNYDTAALTEFINENEPKLVADQREAFSQILNAVFTGCGGIFFLDAPGGTGKTFLINLILAKVRQRKEIALAVASSGIAATLLSGGRTAHSTFKLPLNLASTESPTCSITKNSGRAKVLQQCKLIVWDECTMSHKAAFEALDKTMQDLKENKNRMGGITMVLAGDFRQTLPVIPRGTRADEMQACVKSSYIWRDIKKLGLTTNMRVHVTGDPNAQQFANKLLQMGNGNMSREHENGSISMEGIGNIVGTQQELKKAVFTNLDQHFKNHAWLRERAILAPKNDAVNLINKQLLYELPGDLQLYKSVDTTSNIEDALNYPTEFLNSLDPPGLPSHCLELKIGAPIMLLRNLDPPKLCNGTRLTIKKLSTNVITATIMTGYSAGEDVLLSRIPIIPSDVPFQFKRLQFPIRLSFAMSINKAQGQSLKVVGLNLMNPCFSHGQLYVGCSRVGMPQNLYILAPNGRTANIVYPEALIH